MPNNFRTGYKRKFNKKRKYRLKKRRNAKRSGNSLYVTKQMSFPTNTVVRMRYSNMVVFAPGAGVVSQHFVSANSIWNPEHSAFPALANEHNPMGFDQWSAFYDRYVVLRSTLKVHVQGNNAVDTTDTPIPLFACIVTAKLVDSNTATALTSINNQLELNTSKMVQMSPALMAAGKKFSIFYSARGWHGVEDVADADALEGTFGSATADPALPGTYPQDESFYCISCAPDNEDATGGSISCRFTVDYTVLMKDPADIAGSDLVVGD